MTGKSSEHQRRSAATPTRESSKNRGDGWLRRGLGPSFGLRGNTKAVLRPRMLANRLVLSALQIC